LSGDADKQKPSSIKTLVSSGGETIGEADELKEFRWHHIIKPVVIKNQEYQGTFSSYQEGIDVRSSFRRNPNIPLFHHSMIPIAARHVTSTSPARNVEAEQIPVTRR
jgi:hypothetical protein